MTLCAQLPTGGTPSWLRGQRTNFADIWPQGWDFFASQPDSAVITAERIGPDGRPSGSLLAPQMSAADLWGLGQTSTVQFNQARTLATEVPEKDWTACADLRSARCVAEAPAVLLQNGFTPGIVCGEFVFIRSRPTTAVTTPESGSIALVKVDCR